MKIKEAVGVEDKSRQESLQVKRTTRRGFDRSLCRWPRLESSVTRRGRVLLQKPDGLVQTAGTVTCREGRAGIDVLDGTRSMADYPSAGTKRE